MKKSYSDISVSARLRRHTHIVQSCLLHSRMRLYISFLSKILVWARRRNCNVRVRLIVIKHLNHKSSEKAFSSCNVNFIIVMRTYNTYRSTIGEYNLFFRHILFVDPTSSCLNVFCSNSLFFASNLWLSTISNKWKFWFQLGFFFSAMSGYLYLSGRND